MTADALGDCRALWRRTLLIEADGSRDTGTDVLWLQGISAYVDSRGFAGELLRSGDVFEWRRDIDIEPPQPGPDVGTMRWDGDTLVETGMHDDYVEHWVRDPGPATPCWALTLRSPRGGALLLRVGAMFGWAAADTVVVDRTDGPQWAALDLAQAAGELHANGVRWSVERSEGNVEL
ncbi:hypothetical protein MDOR_12490 [Mycolicibacterium doricum]|jgi:hypothetical protein|uniref:Uncharacterized protein n=1 Tax=Mycolicibacterium doricum TaxID=126673 RepID=A0A1X1TG07_9MYCO|nr:hypothetical protein [Mycolicibacterium doricum]MCV7266805.1 hypothetical protein [Mycolicibacterium doricum]ORV43477.1 hypothetical protein AWC01_06110 [Mycolicibacterium doricum]BBZ07080.1 hypothetical protein MDOR_12490 [Mycolicibacterium doricum]